METKTIKSYQKEVLAKYKSEKGGDMRGYLGEPTRSQIRDACIYLFNRRNEKNDEYILNRFFQFKNDDNKLREIENFGEGKFRSIENFLKEDVENTSAKNLNLISWLIDFKPRPYEEYLKSDIQKPNIKSTDGKTENEPITNTNNDDDTINRPSIWVKISISIMGILLLIFGVQKYNNLSIQKDPESTICMTWADSLFIKVSCDEGPLSKFGTKVEPMIVAEFKNMRKVKVDAAYQFFTDTGKPLIWYHKNGNNEHEYFTAPGLHPVDEETLRKITPYIIQTYVPMHLNKKESFAPE